MRRLAQAALIAALAGCAADDPYNASDRWQPTGANAGNMAAMAARPRDLILGRGRSAGDARLSVDAIERVWDGRARPLSPATGASSTGAASSGRSAN